MMLRAPTREFRDWTSDSRRWTDFSPRPGDVVVATAPKCGTTWTQRIVGMLLRQSAAPFPVQDEQPWIDMRSRPIKDMLAMLEALPGRRCVKTHSPLDALPFYDDVLYIHVARDPRDACMSYLNHTSGFTPLARAGIDHNGMTDEMIGKPWPVPPADPRDFFRAFMRCSDAAPVDFNIAEYCDLERSYWAERHRPNVLMVHYNDLKADLDGEGGADQFLHQGTNQRWRDVATADDLTLYEAAASDGMSPNLKAWAEQGRLVAGDPVAFAD